MRPLSSGAAVLCAAVLAAACSKTLNVVPLESMLRDQLASKLKFDAADVACPSDVKLVAGGTFECTARDANGTTITIEVTQKDDEGHVVWKASLPRR